MKKLDLDDIEAIRRDPLTAAQTMQQLRDDISMLLLSLENLKLHAVSDSVRTTLDAHIYNLRQRYPK
jgi:hypothetical protein